jgi:hypothetical protein
MRYVEEFLFSIAVMKVEFFLVVYLHSAAPACPSLEF